MKGEIGSVLEAPTRRKNVDADDRKGRYSACTAVIRIAALDNGPYIHCGVNAQLTRVPGNVLLTL